MIAKSLITILTLLNPFVFFAKQPLSAVTKSIVSRQLSQENQNNFLGAVFQFVNPNFLPIRDWDIGEPYIEARAAAVVTGSRVKPFANKSEANRNILYQKNIDEQLPIASLTKLMTAVIVLDSMELDDTVIISNNALECGHGTRGELVVDEAVSVRTLLYALLMESSNDAACALAEHYERYHADQMSFVNLMNEKARTWGLGQTTFADTSGLASSNISTVRDIIQLTEQSFRYPLIWEIMKTPAISLSSADGSTVHHWTNTDQLLNHLPYIIGGKTGYTSAAGGCLVLAIKRQVKENALWCELYTKQSEYFITVVLGAEARFLQTEKLIQWAETAYKW